MPTPHPTPVLAAGGDTPSTAPPRSRPLAAGGVGAPGCPPARPTVGSSPLRLAAIDTMLAIALVVVWVAVITIAWDLP